MELELNYLDEIADGIKNRIHLNRVAQDLAIKQADRLEKAFPHLFGELSDALTQSLATLQRKLGVAGEDIKVIHSESNANLTLSVEKKTNPSVWLKLSRSPLSCGFLVEYTSSWNPPGEFHKINIVVKRGNEGEFLIDMNGLTTAEEIAAELIKRTLGS